MCKCRLCGNREKRTSNNYCRCGTGKNKGSKSCIDVLGQRATKCPCFKDGSLCQESCKCVNCANSKPKCSEIEGDKKSRVSRMYKTYKKKRTTEFLGHGNKLPDGSWTDQETSTLIHCANLLERMPLESEISNLHQFYSIVCDSSFAKARLNIRQKTVKSVKSKLEHLSKVSKYYS